MNQNEYINVLINEQNARITRILARAIQSMKQRSKLNCCVEEFQTNYINIVVEIYRN